MVTRDGNTAQVIHTSLYFEGFPSDYFSNNWTAVDEAVSSISHVQSLTFYFRTEDLRSTFAAQYAQDVVHFPVRVNLELIMINRFIPRLTDWFPLMCTKLPDQAEPQVNHLVTQLPYEA